MTALAAPPPVVSREWVVRETLHCRDDNAHFALYAKVRDPLRGPIPFEYWPHLADLDRLAAGHRLLVILKSRQIGLSWWMALQALRRARFFEAGRVLQLSINETEAAELLEKSKFILRNLPPWLGEHERAAIEDNSTWLRFGRRESAIRALPATEDAGSGETAGLVQADEHAKHRHAVENYAAIKPTVDAGGSLWLVSSAKGMGGLFYDTFTAASQGGFDILPSGMWAGRAPGPNGFLAVFLPWSLRPGRDAAWYGEQQRSYSPAMLAQEYPTTPDEAFLQSGRPVFPGVSLTPPPPLSLPLSLKDDFPPETIVYRLPAAESRYLIGADVAEGLAHGDRSCAVVVQLDDLGRGSEAAHLCGTFEPELFALQLDALGLAYGGRLGVERNGPGVAVLQKLRGLVAERIARGDPQPYSLYHHVEPGRDPVQAGQVLPPAHLAGWRTTAASKPVLVQELGEALRTDLLRIHTPALLSELRAYQYDDFGRTAAPSGQHDDRVIALGLAWQLRHAYTLVPRPAPRPIAYTRDGADAARDRLHRAFFGNVVAG